MTDITEVSKQAWNSIKLDTQPDYDSLVRNFVLELEQRAQAVIDTGIAEEGESYVAKFDQAVKGLINGNAPQAMAMAAEIPEDVKEELIEEEAEEKPKKKPRKPKVIKVAATRGRATTTKRPAPKPVAKKK